MNKIEQARLCLYRVMLIAFFLITACNKDPTEEDQIQISTDAPPLTILPGPDMLVNITLNSDMPPKGINIEYRVNDEATGSLLLLGNLKATQVVTKLNISPIPRQVICKCIITASSFGDKTNRDTASFRLAYK